MSTTSPAKCSVVLCACSQRMAVYAANKSAEMPPAVAATCGGMRVPKWWSTSNDRILDHRRYIFGRTEIGLISSGVRAWKPLFKATTLVIVQADGQLIPFSTQVKRVRTHSKARPRIKWASRVESASAPLADCFWTPRRLSFQSSGVSGLKSQLGQSPRHVTKGEKSSQKPCGGWTGSLCHILAHEWLIKLLVHIANISRDKILRDNKVIRGTQFYRSINIQTSPGNPKEDWLLAPET